MKKSLIFIMLIIVSCCTFIGCTSSSNEEIPTQEVQLQQYQLDLTVVSSANFLFSTYDIDIYFDDDLLSTIQNGDTFTQLLEAEEGTHKIIFYKSSNHEVKGSTDIKLTEDTAFQCKINSHSTEINISDKKTSSYHPDITQTTSESEPLTEFNSSIETETAQNTISTEQEENSTQTDANDSLHRTQKTGSEFRTLEMGLFQFQIPTYWNEQMNQTEDNESVYLANAETDDKLAVLTIFSITDTEDTVSFDWLEKEQEQKDIITGCLSTFTNSECTDTQIYNTGNLKGLLQKFTAEQENLTLSGELFTFPSEQDNKWFYVILFVYDNAEFMYDEDFEKMLYSIVPIAPPDIDVSFSQEYAQRAAIVALTNSFAMDVFTSDGNTYDTSKFHSYADVSGYFLTISDSGTWTAKNENTWHVEHLILVPNGYNVEFNASLDVSFDGNSYIVSNVKGTLGAHGANPRNATDISEIEVGSSAPILLTIEPKMIEEDRNPEEILEEDHSDDLDKYAARKAFEKYGKTVFPYGFKCHWIANLLAEEQSKEGAWYFKVGVTIKNAYGQKYDAIAEGIITGTTNSPKVEAFNID